MINHSNLFHKLFKFLLSIHFCLLYICKPFIFIRKPFIYIYKLFIHIYKLFKFFFNEREMNQQFFEHDEDVQMTRPNSKGIRNQFFLFMTILKNAEYVSISFSIFTLFADLIINIFFSIYPILPYVHDEVKTDPDTISIFPPTSLLYYFSPGFISTDIWIFFSLGIIIITVVSFFLCLYKPTLAINLHWVLNSQVHIILIPFVSLSFSFCLFSFNSHHLFSWFFNALMILLATLYIPYLVITCLLFCFDTNSILRPNPIFAEWFYGNSIFVPALSGIQAICNSFCTRVPLYYSDILFIFVAVIHLLYLIHVLYKMPFIIAVVNQFVATNCSFVVIMNIAAVVIMSTLQSEFDPWIISLVPVLYTSLFFFIYYLSEHWRNSTYRFLEQFDQSVGDFTVDAIQITLTSYHSEHQIQLIIRDSFLSANKNVLSQHFLQYCLQLYPKSQWLLSTVSFLYSIVWSANPALYRVLLHLSSLNIFNALPAFVIYQCVYSLMQSSKEEVSPIIKRDLMKYRRVLALYAEQHEMFWSSAANSDFNSFSTAISEVVDCNRELSVKLRNLIIKYPFCPSVRLEASLYYSDIQHDYKESAKAFQKYIELTESNESVSRQLFRDFFTLFPITRPLSDSLHFDEKKKNESNDLIFISFNETHEYASRYMLPPFKDSFYSLCQAFSMPKHRKIYDINFDRARLLTYKILYAISIIIYVCLFVMYLETCKRIVEKTRLFQTRVNYINKTLAFRKDALTCYMDSMVIYNYYMKNELIDVDEDFKTFILNHLYDTYNSLLGYKYILNDDHVLDDIIPHMPNCESLNCTFSFIFGHLHNIATYYSSNSHEFYNSPGYTPSMLFRSVINIVNLTDYVYSQFASQHINSLQNLKEYVGQYVLSLIIIIVLSFVILVCCFELIGNRLYKNLFAVINTVPNSVLKEVAQMFKKIELFVGCKKIEKKLYTKFKSIIPFTLYYILLLIFPLMVGIVIFIHQDAKYTYKMPPHITYFDESQSFVFILSIHEYKLLKNYTSLNGTKVYANFNKSCIHNINNYDDSNLIPKIKLMELLTSKYVQIFYYVCSIISLLLFIIYVKEGFRNVYLFHIMHQFIQYIPENSWKVNPVLRILTRGVLLSNDKVYKFRNDLSQTDVSKVLNICRLKFKNNGKIYGIKGNINNFLGFRPSSLNDLERRLIELNPESEKQINQYFKEKSDQVRSVTFNGINEVNIYFSKNKSSFIIMDNSSHFALNEIIRKINVIKYPLALKSNQINKPFIAILEGIEFFKIIDICEGFDVRDRRNKVVIIDNDNNIEKQKALIKNIKLLDNLAQGKCVICNEGTLFVLGSKVMFPAVKSRIFGSCYEAAKQISKILKLGQVAYPTSLLETEELNTFVFNGPDVSISLVVYN
ncbi:hypothetical protein TRFO_25378 [Tritrichomonas foetus]|uniref:Uncharacterized protein n=1 Tax=Tritrichomonas foetus TaxID=1144522 RepID=A0A1J4K5X5_9EUKA|nr:hypothetical protein TRFO_25378 [Tritrichomonas foetus]|eukprot:OHT06563.1 hypothetical protein TRFO_25378 [Tritrichomonas foetus]